MRILLASVFVHNPAEAFKFYTEVLGFVEKLYVPEADLAIVVSPEEPESTGLLLESNKNSIAKTYQEAVYKSALPVIVFGVDDIHKEYARLKNLGVVFRKAPTMTDAGIEAILEDSCGNLIQIYQLEIK